MNYINQEKNNAMNVITYIEQLILKERMYRVRQSKKLGDCYFADAMIYTSWQAGNLESYLGKESTEVNKDFPIISVNNSPVVHYNSDNEKAIVELPTMTRMRVIVNGKLAEIESFRRLIYYVESREDEIRIFKMISINESDNLRPVVASEDLNINTEDLKKYRQSYMYLSYVRVGAGGSISDDLVGSDKKADVDRVYHEASSWVGFDI
jgi:hypothetical protein